MLDTEKVILRQHYQDCLRQVKRSQYHQLFADEKILHSFQVYGAGNFLLKNETTFHSWTPDLIRLAKIAVLFHDIGRFQEILNLLFSPEIKNDHGPMGADILRTDPHYNDPRIIIPIKHHGHMIKDLYDDPEFNNLNDSLLKHQIEQITFLVRDADKIANFYLISHTTPAIRRLFHLEFGAQRGRSSITAENLRQFIQKQTTDKTLCRTTSDVILNLISWIFDLNYLSSFKFIRVTSCLDYPLRVLRKANASAADQIRIENCVKEFLHLKYQQLKG